MLYLTILSVISFVLMYLMEIPILPAATFLKYDLSEVVAIVAGFIFGPVSGSLVILIKSLLFFLSGKNTTGWVGLLASILSGFALVWGTTVWFHLKKSTLSKFMGILLGILSLTIIMTVFNYFFLLPWYGIPSNEIGTYLTTAIIPFNLIKGGISTALSVGVFDLVKSRINSIINK